jgi:hypothetical protein
MCSKAKAHLHIRNKREIEEIFIMNLMMKILQDKHQNHNTSN